MVRGRPSGVDRLNIYWSLTKRVLERSISISSKSSRRKYEDYHPGPLSSPLLCLLSLRHVSTSELAASRYLSSFRSTPRVECNFCGERDHWPGSMGSCDDWDHARHREESSCADVCPMGASIDFLDFLFFRKARRSGLKAEVGLRRTKYFLLVVFIVAALTGLSLAFLMDPMSLLTRFYNIFIYPLAITAINLSSDLLRPLFQALG